MRVESDRQGHHSSEAPACHRCGVPLLEDATFCPYCERWLDDATHGGVSAPATPRGAMLGQRTVLTIGSVLFAAVAFACLAAAFII